jgi:small subunit ribosomal protein S8
MNTDPISDMLTRIRNAYMVGKETVVVSVSKIKEAILHILKEAGYIENYTKDGKNFMIELKYKDNKPAVSHIERISKPGRRLYVKKDEIPVVLSGHGVAIISTPKGVVTGEQAKEQGLGGEFIAKVY